MLVGKRDEKNVAAIEKLIGQPITRTIMEGLPRNRKAGTFERSTNATSASPRRSRKPLEQQSR